MRRLPDRDRILSLLLLAPSVVAVGVFVYAFIGWTLGASLIQWNRLLPLKGLYPQVSFVGLENYIKLFQYGRFQADIRNTVVFTVLFISACLIIGIILANLLDQHVVGENIFRSIFLFPMAVSFIVTGVVWRWILTPGDLSVGRYEGINGLFHSLHLDQLAYGWFTDTTVWHIVPASSLGHFLSQMGLGGLASIYVGVPVALFSLVLAATWQMSGFVMALYLAGLRAIPLELREAARVDGASEWQIFRMVILPLLRPVTLSAVIILGHISLKIYDLVVSMTKAGSGFVTDVPSLFMFETVFQGDQFARGAAIAILMLLAVSILVVPYLRYSMGSEAEL